MNHPLSIFLSIFAVYICWRRSFSQQWDSYTQQMHFTSYRSHHDPKPHFMSENTLFMCLILQSLTVESRLSLMFCFDWHRNRKCHLRDSSLRRVKLLDTYQKRKKVSFFPFVTLAQPLSSVNPLLDAQVFDPFLFFARILLSKNLSLVPREVPVLYSSLTIIWTPYYKVPNSRAAPLKKLCLGLLANQNNLIWMNWL